MLQTDIRCTADKDDVVPMKARRSEVDWAQLTHVQLAIAILLV